MKQDGEQIDGGAESAPRPAIDKLRVGAAASALVSAAIGEIAVVTSRSPDYKHDSLADIEWLILPAAARDQFTVAQAARKDAGFRAPVAVATWAFVSEEVDRRLSGDLTHRIRLRPDEWKCGDIAWIVDRVGAPAGIANAVQWLKAGPFQEREAKVVVRDAKGEARNYGDTPALELRGITGITVTHPPLPISRAVLSESHDPHRPRRRSRRPAPRHAARPSRRAHLRGGGRLCALPRLAR
jgi:cytolysin-activating lysine-acyltransferase